ncbi:MAG: T9SS type A sorting domain-containing protein [Saprospiraceae bacterium]|nr:MAG: T9SS type A sorting domain-containing protein [Saprospiraceae bacterium]
MKAVFILLFSLSFYGFTFGQIEWTGNYKFSEWATELFRKSNGEIILKQGSGIYHDGNGFTVFDSLGNIVFSKTFNNYPEEPGADVSEILELPDSSIVFSVEWDECDISIGAVLKYDKNWNEVWQNYSMPIAGPASLLSDGGFVIGSNSFGSIARFTENGDEIWSNYLNGFSIMDIAATANDTLLIACTEGLIRMDKGGVIDTVFSSLIFDRFEITGNGRFWVQHNDTLSYLSPDFSTIGSIHIPDAAVVDFVFDENEIAILTGPPGVHRFDYSLQQVGSFTLSGENQTFDQVAFYQEGLAIGGAEHYGSAEHGNDAAFIKYYSTGGDAPSSNMDAAIVSNEQGQEAFVTHPWAYEVVFRDIKITVQNFGETPIEQVNLNLEFPEVWLPGWCFKIQQFSKQFDNFLLLPGETIDLTWDSLLVWFEEKPEGFVEFCIWSSIPNHKLDENAANDVHCSDFIVSSKESFLNPSFQIFPNPTASQATLGYQLPPGTTGAVHIFNSIGRQVEVFPVEQASGSLTLPEYPVGLYFVSLVVEGQVVRTERWVQF